MLANGEAVLGGDFFLAGLDSRIIELLDMTALQANDVIMMLALVKLKHGLAAFKMVSHQQSGFFELG